MRALGLLILAGMMMGFGNNTTAREDLTWTHFEKDQEKARQAYVDKTKVLQSDGNDVVKFQAINQQAQLPIREVVDIELKTYVAKFDEGTGHWFIQQVRKDG